MLKTLQTFSKSVKHIRTTGTMQLKNVRFSPRLPKETVKSEITLTEVEDQICTLLDECTQKLKAEKGVVTSCRIAGGWVRDKLLGSESHDIDVALTDMMGHPFAEYFVSFVESKDLPVKTVVKIESNPDQSKHLETARTTVLGVDLDFVNLRNEAYADHSRIPTEVTFGTPLQDALRRDITINALFYNVHSRSVEDFTGKGLPDLCNGVIRTPLKPIETFRDDPLRVVRCVRFASRFGFELVPELREAAQDASIQKALSSKLSRERVGEEVDKMMKGRDPLHAIQLIHDLRLDESIFAVPSSISSTFSSHPTPFAVSLAAATILQLILCPPSPPPLPLVHPTLLAEVKSIPSLRARLYLAAALTSYRGITYPDTKGRTRPAVAVVIRKGLRLGSQNHFLDGIPPLFDAAQLIKDRRWDGKRFGEGRQPERVALGLLMRDKRVHNSNTGSHWASSILFSLVQELVGYYDHELDRLDVEATIKCIELYNALVDRIEELKLPGVVDARPILDGREVIQILGQTKPGVWIGEVLSRVVEWQLEFPEGTKEECAVWLTEERNAGRAHVGDGDLFGSGPGKRVKTTGAKSREKG